jgi:hypothetical protein
MRARDEDTNEILPLFYYTKGLYERNQYGNFLKERTTFKHLVTKPK